MTTGFTGLIFKVWATRMFRLVTVKYRGSYELPRIITVRDGIEKFIWFPSVWRAEMYRQRINKGQFKRYANTPYASGFCK